MFSRIGVAAYKKDLTNTLELCEFLGTHKRNSNPFISVALMERLNEPYVCVDFSIGWL
jgi:hypothetical protein